MVKVNAAGDSCHILITELTLITLYCIIGYNTRGLLPSQLTGLVCSFSKAVSQSHGIMNHQLRFKQQCFMKREERGARVAEEVGSESAFTRGGYQHVNH